MSIRCDGKKIEGSVDCFVPKTGRPISPHHFKLKRDALSVLDGRGGSEGEEYRVKIRQLVG